MNTELKKWLSEFAECVGANADFPEAKPVLVTGSKAGELRSFTITLDQPESVLIWHILCAIGHFAFLSGNPRPWPFPWWLNRPYQFEWLGEITYRIRRAARQKFPLQFQIELWAMGVYCQLGRHHEFADFLKRHPHKTKLLWIFWFGALHAPSMQKFRTCCRILYCFLAAKLTAKTELHN